MPSRRAFLTTSAGLVGAIAGVGSYARFFEPEWLEITALELPVRGLPAALQGKRLVQLSDIHVGPRVRDAYVRETFARVRALRPDIVVVTGDLISHHEAQFPHAEAIYADMPLGALGTFVSFGNHDYGINWKQPRVAASLRTVMENLGATVLVNEVATVEGLQVVGLGDLWGGAFQPDRAFAQVDPRVAQIVLSHNPDTVDLSGWGAYNGWILAGHTHGGQCRAPFLPPPVLPVQNRRYTSGAFTLTAGRHMYISRGVGTFLPVRFNVRPEVTVFTLRSA